MIFREILRSWRYVNYHIPHHASSLTELDKCRIRAQKSKNRRTTRYRQPGPLVPGKEANKARQDWTAATTNICAIFWLIKTNALLVPTHHMPSHRHRVRTHGRPATPQATLIILRSVSSQSTQPPSRKIFTSRARACAPLRIPVLSGSSLELRVPIPCFSCFGDELICDA